MSPMLALGQMVLFSAGQNVMDISKLVVKIVFSAGLALLVRLTENRLSYQLSFQRSIASDPPLADYVASCHHPPISHDSTPLVSETKLPLVSESKFRLVSETMLPLVFETKLPAFQGSPEASNLTESSYPELLESFQTPHLMAGHIIGLLLCSLFAIVAATCISIILSTSRQSKQKSDNQWSARIRWMWAFKLGKHAPLNSATSGGSRQPRDNSPSPPGAYPRHFDFAVGRERQNVNDFRTLYFSRGGPPPPPPPPPMYMAAMFAENRTDWLSFIVLLPILLYLFKKLGRIFARFINRKKKASDSFSTRSLHILPASSDDPYTNAIPPLDSQVPIAKRFVDVARNSSFGLNITRLVGSPSPIPMQSRLSSFIISGARVLRSALKVAVLTTFLLHSCIFYMVPMAMVCATWYYLPNIILSVVFGIKPEGMVGASSGLDDETENRLPVNVEGESEKVKKTVASESMCDADDGSIESRFKTASSPVDIPVSAGPMGRLREQSIIRYLCVWDDF